MPVTQGSVLVVLSPRISSGYSHIATQAYVVILYRNDYVEQEVDLTFVIMKVSVDNKPPTHLITGSQNKMYQYVQL